MRNKKMFAAILCAALVVLVAPRVTGAQTVNDLLVQIKALQAQLNQLLAQMGGSGQLAPTASSIPACVNVAFTRNLTAGSVGADVRCLQAFLNRNSNTIVATSGFGSLGNETTYFGALTQSAVARFQSKYTFAIRSLVGYTDATGFVGPATRAQLNNLLRPAVETPVPTPTVPVGNTVGGITITGKEGTLTVTTNPAPANNTRVYEGDRKVSVMGIRVGATGSDLSVQRVALRFDSKPNNYFSEIYLYDGNVLLDSAPLNESTVSRNSATNYTITLSDFSEPFIVRRGEARVITVKVDVIDAISSGILPSDGSANLTIAVVANGVRAIDQASISQNDPASDTSVTRTININNSQISGAMMSVSRNANTPSGGNLIADSRGNISNAELLSFDVRAQRDDLTIDEINNVTFTTGTGYLVPQVAYLYDDNNGVIDSASPNQSTGVVNFTNLGLDVIRNTVRNFRIKIDDNLADNGSENGKRYRVTVSAASGSTKNFVVQKSSGELLPVEDMSGSAISNDQFVYLSGTVFSMTNVSTTSMPGTSYSPATMTAVFTIQVNAQGQDIYLAKSGAFKLQAVRNSVLPGTDVANTVYRASNVTEFQNSYRISQNTTATFIVTSTYALAGPSGFYDLRVAEIDWGLSDSSPAAYSATYMVNDFVSNFIYLQ